MWDPGGSEVNELLASSESCRAARLVADSVVCGSCSEEDSARECYVRLLLQILHENIPRSVKRSAVRRAVKIASGSGESRKVEDCTYDTGASNGNYIGVQALQRLKGYEDLQYEPCRHTVRLGDGKSTVSCYKTVMLTVHAIDDYDQELEGVTVEFFVMESMGDEIIIGLLDIVGSFYDYFADLLAKAAGRNYAESRCIMLGY